MKLLNNVLKYHINPETHALEANVMFVVNLDTIYNLVGQHDHPIDEALYLQLGKVVADQLINGTTHDFSRRHAEMVQKPTPPVGKVIKERSSY